MVCSRCIAAVKNELGRKGHHIISVKLGEAEIGGDISADAYKALDASLKSLGFEIIDHKKSRIIEKIKNAVVALIHHSDENLDINLSDFIVSKIHKDYSYLSNLFSEVEGTTIEKYFISQRIEKAKELLVYDELSLSEIAYRLGYSSVAHLSNQFKKITGFTPSYFKTLKEHKRKKIEDL